MPPLFRPEVASGLRSLPATHPESFLPPCASHRPHPLGAAPAVFLLVLRGACHLHFRANVSPLQGLAAGTQKVYTATSHLGVSSALCVSSCCFPLGPPRGPGDVDGAGALTPTERLREGLL